MNFVRNTFKIYIWRMQINCDSDLLFSVPVTPRCPKTDRAVNVANP